MTTLNNRFFGSKAAQLAPIQFMDCATLTNHTSTTLALASTGPNSDRIPARH